MALACQPPPPPTATTHPYRSCPGVETALKLLCWSWVVYYDHDASDGAAAEGTELKVNASEQEEPAAAEGGGMLELQSNGSVAAGAAGLPAVEVRRGWAQAWCLANKELAA